MDSGMCVVLKGGSGGLWGIVGDSGVVVSVGKLLSCYYLSN